jgi:uncharacterized membrane protein
MDPAEEQEPHDQDLTQQILEEAERRIQQKAQGAPPENTDAILRANKAVFWMSRHWVGLLNTIVFLYTGGAILAPVLMHVGLPRLASVLYIFYAPFCHQYPFRSWFLFGESFIHPLREPPLSVAAMNALHSVVGDPDMGYKMALCQRDIAIYGAMWGAGLVYGWLPRARRPKTLPLWTFFIFAVMPMLIDGGVQWIAYAVWQLQRNWMPEPFETIPALRALTGALFGIGIAAVGYPELDKYFSETVETLHLRYGWKR